jgi:probable O-glycosylation ligase (exosortase A-associated)
MFAAIWMALLPLSLMSAHVGVLLWVWVALLSPNELLMGFMAGVPFNKLVALTTTFLFFASRERKEPYLDSTVVLLVLLVLSATISWTLGLAPGDDTTELYEKLLKEVVLAFLITAVMTTRHRLHLLVLTIVLSLGFLAVKEGLISLLTAGGHKIIGSGSIGDNNSLATALLMIVPLTWYLARYSAVRAVRLGLYAAMGLSVVTVVMTFSRGGFVGLLLLGLVFVAKSGSKLRAMVLVAAAGALIYALAPDAWFERLDTIQTADNDGSFMGRVVAWKISWLLAMEHPLFGGGPHAIQHLAVWSAYRPYLGSLDFIPTPPADVIPHAAHSIYFEILGDLGFVGLSLFLTLVGVALWQCQSVIRQTRDHPALYWARDLASMAQISLVVYLVTGAALSMGYFELLYIMLAMVSRVRRVVRTALAEVRVPQTLWDETSTGLTPGLANQHADAF